MGHKKKLAQCDLKKPTQTDNLYPALQFLFNIEENDVSGSEGIDEEVNAIEVCGARKKFQGGIEVIESAPAAPPVVQVQTVIKALDPEAIERLAQRLPLAQPNFRGALVRKMCLHNMTLVEITQLMSQILSQSFMFLKKLMIPLISNVSKKRTYGREF